MGALEAVNKSIQQYEAEKHRLTEASKKPGVKGLRAKNELAQLNSGPLAEKLNRDLITAEAKLRMARRYIKKHGGANKADGEDGHGRTDGSVWWMDRDLKEKQTKYGRKK